MTIFVAFTLTAVALTLGPLALGEWLLVRAGVTPAPLNRALGWGAGMSVITLLLSFLGLIGLYIPQVMWLIWSLLLAVAVFQLPRFTPSLSQPGDLRPSEAGWTSVSLRISVSVLLVVIFTTVMTPESRHDPYDYHLSAPLQYILAGRFIEIPWHVFTYMPKNGETLYGFALAVGNDSFAKLIHFLFGCFILRLMYDWLRGSHGYETGLQCAFWAVGLPVFGFVATSAYIDLIRAFWEILALYCLYQTWETPERKSAYFAMSFWFAGMSLGTKYVAWAVFWPGFFLLALITFIRFHRSFRWRLLPLFALASVVPVTSWLVLNAVWTGNPVYPLLPSLFGYRAPAAHEAYEFIRGHAPSSDIFNTFSSGLAYFMKRNWALLLDGNALYSLGLLGLILTPLRFKTAKSGEEWPAWAYAGLGIYIFTSGVAFFFFADNFDGRFFLSSLILLAIPATFLFNALRRHLEQHSNWGPYFLPLIVLLLFSNALIYRYSQLTALNESMLPALTGAQRSAALSAHFPFYPIIEWANENLPDDAFVLGLGYPLERRDAPRLKFGYFPFALRLDRPSPQELANALRDYGITHVLEPFIEIKPGVELAILKPDYLIPVFQYRGSTLYRLRGAGEPA
ncbi:MAG: hypothetical protein GC154_10230 [bacterium]|nr:hypothetical protein [bacterium]